MDFNKPILIRRAHAILKLCEFMSLLALSTQQPWPHAMYVRQL